jgi:hypothetical protein
MGSFMGFSTSLVPPKENGFVGIIWFVVPPSRKLAITRVEKLCKTWDCDWICGEVFTSNVMIPPLLIPRLHCEISGKTFVERFKAPVNLGSTMS